MCNVKLTYPGERFQKRRGCEHTVWFDEVSDYGLPKLTAALFHLLLPHQLFAKPVREMERVPRVGYQREGKMGWKE